MNKKIISFVLSFAMIISCFACLSSLSVFAIDNGALGSKVQPLVLTVTTTAEPKAAGATARTARSVSEAYPSTYPEWHCECGNVWADPSHNSDADAPETDLHYLWGEGKCKNEDGAGCDGTLIKWTGIGAKTAVDDVIAAGNVYLTTNHAMQGQMNVYASGTPQALRIDLNGFTMTKATGRAFRIATAGGILTVTDTSEAGTGKLWLKSIGGTQAGVCLSAAIDCRARFYGGYIQIDATTGYAPFATIQSGNDYSIYEGVTVDASAVSTATDNSICGVVQVSGTGKLYMNGATMKGLETTDEAKANGGNIIVQNGGTVIAENCEISGGRSRIGGNLFVQNNGTTPPATTTVKMTNCVIKDGTAHTTSGGNMYIGSAANKNNVGYADSTRYVEFTDCTISGGTAKTLGGNIFTAGASSYTSSVFLINCDVTGGTAGTDGGNIDCGTYGRVFMNGGNISGGTATTGAGGNVFVTGGGARFDQSNAILTTNPAASTISDGTAATNGGNIYAAGGTCNLRKATVTGGTATSGKGGSIMNNGATCTIQDCPVSGGIAGGDGDTIFNRANMTVNGSSNINGEFLFANDNKTSEVKLTLSGSVKISDLIVGAPHAAGNEAKYINNIALNSLSNSAAITLTVEADPDYLEFAGQVFADQEAAFTRDIVTSGATEENVKCFTSTKDNYILAVTDAENGKAALKYIDPATLHIHKLSKNAPSAEGTDSAIDFGTPVATESELTAAIAAAGNSEYTNIYLTDNITLTEATNGSSAENYFINIDKTTGAKKLNICLNGHTLKSHDNTASKIFQINVAGAVVNVCDCATGEEKGALVGTGGNITSSTGAVAYIASGGKLTLYGVNVTGGNAKLGSSINTMTGTFEAYDSNFAGGSSNNSGEIYAGAAKSAITIKGCTITPASGYGLYVEDGENINVVNTDITSANKGAVLNKKNLVITGGSITSTGGNAISNTVATCNLTLNGVTVTSTTNRCLNNGTGTAQGSSAATAVLNNCVFTAAPSLDDIGGCILNKGILTINGGTYTGRTDSTINKAGGTIYCGLPENVGTEEEPEYLAMTHITGGAIIQNGNTGTANGGNIVVLSNHKVIIDGNAIIRGGVSGTQGGNIFVSGGDLTVNDGATVTGGSAAQQLGGGNIYATNFCKLNIENAVISNGFGFNGGNLYLHTGDIKIDKATVSGGVATNGGNIFLTADSTAVITDTVITDGVASAQGGNVFTGVGDAGEKTISGCTLTGGTAGESGGNLFWGNPANKVITGNTYSGGKAPFGADVFMHTGEFTFDEGSTAGAVSVLYPFGTLTNNGTIETISYATYDAGKKNIAKLNATVEEAFINWYLLPRFSANGDTVRFFALADNEGNYAGAGFKFQIEGEDAQNLATYDVYTVNGEKEISSYSLATDRYFRSDFGFDEEVISGGKSFTVTPYLVTNGGEVIYGVSQELTMAEVAVMLTPVVLIEPASEE